MAAHVIQGYLPVKQGVWQPAYRSRGCGAIYGTSLYQQPIVALLTWLYGLSWHIRCDSNPDTQDQRVNVQLPTSCTREAPLTSFISYPFLKELENSSW